MSAKFDPVNNPAHYAKDAPLCSCGKPIEPIQLEERLNFYRGNAVKYIWRAGKKEDEIQDLEKARWYLDREIQRLKRK